MIFQLRVILKDLSQVNILTRSTFLSYRWVTYFSMMKGVIILYTSKKGYVFVLSLNRITRASYKPMTAILLNGIPVVQILHNMIMMDG